MSFLKNNLKLATLLFLVLLNVFVWYSVSAEERGGVLAVHYLDVGQGDATLIITPNGNRVLIDAGPGERVLEKLSEKLPFYDQKIDLAIATHPHADHIEGFIHIFDRFDVGAVLDSGNHHDSRVYENYLQAVSRNEIQKILAERGMRINLDEEVYIDILFPDRDVSGVDPDSASVWSHLKYGETAFIFTGDAPQSIERYVVSLDGERLRSDVLKAGHHGSRTSTSEIFVETVSPTYGVISAEKDSRHGHPHQEVLETLDKFGVKILSTAESGTITFVSDGESVGLR